MMSEYETIFEKIRSELKDGLEKKDTKEQFATRGMVKNVISQQNLELVYLDLKATNSTQLTATDKVNATQFADRVEMKKLQSFLAVIIYAKCSTDATKAFVDKLVFGNMAGFQEEDQETPNLLPASKDYLASIFSKSSDVGDFFSEQRIFCTVVLGGLDILTISSNDQVSMPWVEQEQIGEGGFGVVYKVKVAKGHLAMDGDFNQPYANAMDAARKDFICVDTAEASFKKEVKAIRDIFSGRKTHNNILKSLGALIIEGKPSTFSLLMPLADLDLGEYMRRNPEVPLDRSFRESIIRSAIGLAGGLVFLHTGLETPECDQLVCYHMDLKPSNILIFHDHRKRSDVPYRDMIWRLSDFGLSRVKTRIRPQEDLNDLSSLFKTRFEKAGQASMTQNFRGTDMFLPAEAELGDRTMNEKSDIWSFGCILSLVFTYMGQGYYGFEGFSESRLRCSNKGVDFFYEYKPSTGYRINSGVTEQHDKLIELAKKHNASEEAAVRYMLRSLESKVLLIDQSSRCNAATIVELLQATLKKYSTVETEPTGHEKTSNPSSWRRKAQMTFKGILAHRNKDPIIETDIRPWRLEPYKDRRYKDCVCSPDGSQLAYWTDNVITLYDHRSGLSNSVLNQRTDSLTSTTNSTDSEREKTLKIAGQHVLASWSRSWRSVRLTDRYLIAATTDETFNCYIFDVELDHRLNTYSRVTLQLPGIQMFTASPDRNSLACILRDGRGRNSLFTGRIADSPPPQTTAASSIYSDSIRPEHKDAGVCIADQREVTLALPLGNIVCLTLESRNQGYIIVHTAATLSVNLFTIQPLFMIQQNLAQKLLNNTAERLFTDMACLQNYNQRGGSEIIIASQAERFFHLRYDSFERSPTVVIHPLVQSYRILKIATVPYSRKFLALGTQSGKSHVLLLDIETQNPDVRPKITKLADIHGISASYQAQLSVYSERNKTIARITVDTLEGRYLMYQIDVSNSMGT